MRAPPSFSQPLRLCFDLDHTLVTAPTTPNDYSTCQPIAENVAVVRSLFSQGHTIILHTERKMAAYGGNVGAATADCATATLSSLKKLSIPYHEIAFGKPHADFYVDDLAVSALSELHKEVGFYPNQPACGSAAPASPAAPTNEGSAAAGSGVGGGGASLPKLLLAAMMGAAVASFVMSSKRK